MPVVTRVPHRLIAANFGPLRHRAIECCRTYVVAEAPSEDTANPWLVDAAGDVITPDLSQNLRSYVFRHLNPCAEKRVSQRWFFATSQEFCELMARSLRIKLPPDLL